MTGCVFTMYNECFAKKLERQEGKKYKKIRK